MGAIEALLTMEPGQRPAAAHLKAMPLFRNVDWDHQLDAEPPFVPTPDDLHDTGYFQGRFTDFYFFLRIVYCWCQILFRSSKST